MRYYFNYQYLPKGAEQPVDTGDAVRITDEQTAKPPTLPDVGDYVQINYFRAEDEILSGRVKSRLFRYLVSDEDPDLHQCLVNIVVEETDDDWGKLIKE
ncbi:hypothetical protein GCM10010082_26680 [Kushneria pakistanensis]|uniref:Uncharacterized protein n=1 Tax=Kushneria pakistanensis TaxID=1508770 RepID=A0ABQ3FNF7_9GAMM|nr:hypothetical protein [Kushneria pakistanensis]GHC31072.1 hypothetical protein GCM10010082_26680 [Kushneria pakistanensis]